MFKTAHFASSFSVMLPASLLWLLSPFNNLSGRRYVFAFSTSQKSALRDVNRDFAMWIKMLIFAPKTMANDCTDIDIVLRQINQRLRKLEKSDSEKNEEIGRLNRVINQKNVEIHNLTSELAIAKERIKEFEEAADDTSSTPGKPEKNSSNSSIPPSQESIASREQRRTKSLRKPSGKPSGGQPGHKGHTLQTIAEPDVIVKHEPVYCKCCGRLLIDIPCQKIRKTQIVDIKVVVETCEEQYYEKVCLAHLLRNAEYLNELDSNQNWSRRFIQLIEHSINLRREGNITSRKIKVLKTKMKNLLGESLTHLDNEFEKFKRGILKVKDYLFTFLSNPSVPYDNNASERGVRKIKIKQKVSGCFRTDGGADDFAKLHSIAETAMKNGNSKFNAILAVVQQ